MSETTTTSTTAAQPPAGSPGTEDKTAAPSTLTPEMIQQLLGSDQVKEAIAKQAESEADRRARRAIETARAEAEAEREQRRQERLKSEGKIAELLEAKEAELARIQKDMAQRELHTKTLEALSAKNLGAYAKAFEFDSATLEGRLGLVEFLHGLREADRAEAAKSALSVAPPKGGTNTTNSKAIPDGKDPAAFAAWKKANGLF